MSLWSQARLIDIMSQIDMELAAEEIPEGDLEKVEFPAEHKNSWNKRKTVIVSGVAASVALTAVAVFVCSKHDLFRHAA